MLRFLISLLVVLICWPAPAGAWEWQVYGGNPGSSPYCPLQQINLTNVKNLKVNWTYRTGDSVERPATTIECTPIVVRGVMYLTTAQMKVSALDAATGKRLWTYDPFEGLDDDRPRGVSRGVTYWESGNDRRIFSTFRARLVALNADTGKPVPTFGDKGQVDLRKGLDRDIGDLAYYVTSPGILYKDLLILGSTTGEGPQPSAPGHIRAFDVRTGERRWIFHTIPHPGEFGHDTWSGDSWKTAGGTNDWGGLSVDEKRGLVFLALGSPTFDFYAGDRLGRNLFGNSVVALNASTGKYVWHFQTVHHDVWDYDLPTAPTLITVKHGGRKIDAVAQVTKMGFVFLLDRQNGKPLFPVEERPVPKSDMPGEELWPTQPFPLKPPPFSGQRFTVEDVTNIAPENHAYVLEQFKKARAGNIYTPPSKQGTIIFPGFAGGGNWGGAAFDPASGILFVNSNNSPNLMTLVDGPAGASFRFDHKGYILFKDQEGYPAIKPPWGQFNAIDLNAGEIRWQVPLGEYKELTARGIPPTGINGYGGPMATAGGLVFIAATSDAKFRAFDTRSGKVVWEAQLETGAYATPCSYDVNGKQYIVIAAGGGRFGDAAGDKFIAFALP